MNGKQRNVYINHRGSFIVNLSSNGIIFKFNRNLVKHLDVGFKWYIFDTEKGANLDIRMLYNIHVRSGDGFGMNTIDLAEFPEEL
jgi:hypothetical protein